MKLISFMIKIRRAKLSDANKIAPLSMDFLSQHSHYSPLDPVVLPSLKKEAESWKKIIRGKKYIVFVAQFDHKIVGLINLTFPKRFSFKKIKKVGEIDALMVDKESRNLGLGKALLKKAKAYFKSKKVKFIQINVRLKNPALKFWEKQGFKRFDVRMNTRI